MPSYRIHKLKDQPRQNFRWAAYTAGAASVKPRDYEPAGEIDAATPYAAWGALQGTPGALDVGDLLEDSTGQLRIFKFVGFEEARWVLPEVKPVLDQFPAAAGSPAPAA